MTKKMMMPLALLCLGGCATVQIPPERLESSQSSIRGAEEVGALSVPAAKLHLQLAKEQTETAKQMAAQGNTRSLLMLARAESDAELALGLAREATVHKEAVKAGEDLNAVRAVGAP